MGNLVGKLVGIAARVLADQGGSREDVGLRTIAGTLDVADVRPAVFVDGGYSSGTCKRK